MAALPPPTASDRRRSHPRRLSSLPGVAAAGACLLFTAAGCERGPGEAADAGAPDAAEQGSLAERLAAARVVELTHPLNEETLVWPTSIPFEFETVYEGWVDDEYFYAARNLRGPEHGGTHLDAPIHFAEGRWTTDEIPPERLMGPGAVVDVTDRAAEEPSYRVRVEDLTAWEERHGPIPQGAVLLLHTGHDRFWSDAEAYFGTPAQGEEAAAELQFPGLHPEAARWLVQERDVVAVGLDTPSLDHGPSTRFETHRILADANIYGLENVANLGELPPTGALILALPPLLEGGTGGPVRILGVIE